MSKKQDDKQDDSAEKPSGKLKIAELRVFKVTFADREAPEIVTAHHATFPHPREVVFHDLAVEGNMVLQYMRRALYGWTDVTEITVANSGATVVQ